MLDPRRWHPNVRWLAIRIAALPVIFVVVSFASYFLIAGPGTHDPAESFVGDPTPELLEVIRDEYGYNDPFVERYWRWLTDASRGDLGENKLTRVPVRTYIGERWWVSAELVVIAAALAVGGGAFLSTAMRSSRWPAAAARATALVADALPFFAVATVVLIVPADLWDYTPPLGATISLRDDPWDHARQFVPPAAVIALAVLGTATRSLARSYDAGLPVRGLRAFAAVLPWLVGILLVIEFTFGLRGLGTALFESMFRRDQAMTQALLTLALLVLVVVRLFTPERGLAANRGVRTWADVRRNRPTLVPASFILMFALVAAVGPLVAPYEGDAIGSEFRTNPSWDHWFGTDSVGRDRFASCLEAVRPTFQYASLVTVCGFAPGILAGAAVNRSIPRLNDLVAAVCSLVVSLSAMLVLVAALAFRDQRLMIATLVLVPLAAAYGLRSALSIRSMEGRERGELLRALALPATAGALRVFAAVVLLHAAVGSLGFDPFGFPTPNLGEEVGRARNFFPIQYPPLLLPALMLFAIIASFLALADALDAPSQDRPGAEDT